MTDQTAVLTTDLPVAAPAAPSRPASMSLIGTMIPTLHKLVAAARQGYICTDLQIYGHTGQIMVNLERGNPDADLVEALQADMADVLEAERIQKEKAIEDAAIRLVAEREKAAKQAEIAAAIAEQEKTLRALKRQQVAAA
ncbi:hypothetical protein [Massilia brevitalea]|uniref:hypothetical protein n=1 Tax=Massilia brevitalea TaxID=442526 RepID=UPI0027391B4E|nr:hypothetical protein [Massilia brevitalea]